MFFRTGSGTEPVRDWLLELNPEERKTIGADILSVQYAWPLGKPLVDSLGSGLWEIRSRLKDRIARTLSILVNHEIVLLHGFVKKTQKTPDHELDLARNRQSQYIKHYG